MITYLVEIKFVVTKKLGIRCLYMCVCVCVCVRERVEVDILYFLRSSSHFGVYLKCEMYQLVCTFPWTEVEVESVGHIPEGGGEDQ